MGDKWVFCWQRLRLTLFGARADSAREYICVCVWMNERRGLLKIQRATRSYIRNENLHSSYPVPRWNLAAHAALHVHHIHIRHQRQPARESTRVRYWEIGERVFGKQRNITSRMWFFFGDSPCARGSWLCMCTRRSESSARWRSPKSSHTHSSSQTHFWFISHHLWLYEYIFKQIRYYVAEMCRDFNNMVDKWRIL